MTDKELEQKKRELKAKIKTLPRKKLIRLAIGVTQDFADAYAQLRMLEDKHNRVVAYNERLGEERRKSFAGVTKISDGLRQDLFKSRGETQEFKMAYENLKAEYNSFQDETLRLNKEPAVKYPPQDGDFDQNVPIGDRDIPVTCAGPGAVEPNDQAPIMRQSVVGFTRSLDALNKENENLRRRLDNAYRDRDDAIKNADKRIMGVQATIDDLVSQRNKSEADKQNLIKHTTSLEKMLTDERGEHSTVLKNMHDMLVKSGEMEAEIARLRHAIARRDEAVKLSGN